MSKDLIVSFYEAFSRRDGEAMAKCYAPNARFSDPVFPDLEGARVGEMWKMLCARGKDLVVELDEVSEDGSSARWTATYSFSGTGRRVVNKISARFAFQNGKITEHHDTFDLWRWASMALGPTGTLLGWTPLVKSKIRKTAAKGLETWLAKSNPA